MPGHSANILIVDDEPHICELLKRWLTADGHVCVTAQDGETALKVLNTEKFDLLISDIMMPRMSGMDLLMVMKPLFPDIAVIMVTAVDDRKTAIMALELGAYGYVTKPFERNEIIISIVNGLERRRLTQLSRNYERELEAKVLQRTLEVREREEEIIFRLLSATGCRDDETGAHVRRIGLYSAEMARALGWSREDVEQIRLAAPMHDVGKIGIPDAILRKPGKLTPDEFEIMKGHAEIGAGILNGSQVPLIRMAHEIALLHHERWDGSGYPRGLVEAEIPLSAAIVAVVDVYDAMVHDRVYRRAFPEDQALSIMESAGEGYFGSRVFECFMDLVPTLGKIRQDVKESLSENGDSCSRIAF
jgi:putative two-component system response regulator